MRLRLNLTRSGAGPRLPGPLASALLSGGFLAGGALAGALLAQVLLAGGCATVPDEGPVDKPPERVERRLGLMGTWLTLEVEAPTRARALAASEAAVRALEATEARLSTWRESSELARLNRTPVGERFELSAELARDLHAARAGWQRTQGAFDPAVGALVAAWGLRSGGRVPSAREREQALVPGGFAALRLEPLAATRTQAALRIEEGAFGKGVGLDAACAELARAGATRACVDLGGQVAVLGARARPFEWGVADPRARDAIVLRVALAAGSLATSGNAERGIVVDGVLHGHVLDPRTGLPADDFGSLTVHARDATTADCLSTGLYVLGPEAALAFARAQEDVDVLVLEPRPDGRLLARATGALGAALEVLAPRVDLVALPDPPPHGCGPLERRPERASPNPSSKTPLHRIP